ncbi:Uroplakin-1a [Chelonia mydas]|uniref:Uroplakin-1a n=1 Tax=Chelonia mydas TaxID=8469 RepID=M7BCK4_CHEMY|nr:Uroplakin-1a [Chelonia mydas]
MMEKGNPFIVGLLILGNIIILMCGIALYAETVWVTADQYKVYPILGVSGKDDVYAGAWIAIFCGFAFFCLGVFGIVALARGSRLQLMLYLVLMLIVYIFECASCITSYTHRDFYLVLMLIVYIFECASCITSYTHRDFVVSNHRMVTKQMLTFYAAPTAQGRELTRMWDRIMMECCGATGPLDWVNHTSTFRSFYPEGLAPWPFLCCKRDANFVILSPEGCRVGHVDYINTKGCFEHIENAINSYTWGISWFGFAILMFTCPVMLLAMYHYTTL